MIPEAATTEKSMNMFGKLTTDGLEETGDRLGGGGVLDSGVYEGTIKAAYAGKSQSSDAQSITVMIDINGREFRETYWVTNKNGENFYLDKNDKKKKVPLPGFTAADDLCLLATGHPLAEQEVEEKVLNLYDFTERKEVPQNVPVLTGLTGKSIRVGIIRQVVDKTQKNDAGVYVPTGETREENIADKFFHAESKRTVTEFRQKIEEPIFHDKWAEKNTGTVRDRSTKGAGAQGGAPGRPGAPASAAAAPKTSLFA